MNYFVYECRLANKIVIADIYRNVLKTFDLNLYKNGILKESMEDYLISPELDLCYNTFLSIDKAVEYLKKCCFKIPDGEFTGYKICANCVDRSPVLVKLKIPADARRVKYVLSNKCRCDKAFVESIDYGNETVAKSYIESSQALRYIVGYNVRPDGFNEDAYKECTKGIHFFMSEQEAFDYLRYLNE